MVCLTMTPTEYIYPSPPPAGPNERRERGIIVGLINYPRFPEEPHILQQKCFDIARDLMIQLHQCHVTVVGGYGSVMLSNRPQIEKVKEARG